MSHLTFDISCLLLMPAANLASFSTQQDIRAEHFAAPCSIQDIVLVSQTKKTNTMPLPVKTAA